MEDTTTKQEEIDALVNLPWQIEYKDAEEWGEKFIIVRIKGLDCFSEGDTKEEAANNIKEALNNHISAMVENGNGDLVYGAFQKAEHG